jgi:hypothetical protein
MVVALAPSKKTGSLVANRVMPPAASSFSSFSALKVSRAERLMSF